jgi:hypothetical protein
MTAHKLEGWGMSKEEKQEYEREIQLKREDIWLLVATLRDIYACRGEDQWIANKVNAAIEQLHTAV